MAVTTKAKKVSKGFMDSKDMPYTLQSIALSSVKEYGNNAKEHTPEQISALKKTILALGFRDPIAVTEDGTLVEGHGRVKALTELGAKFVPALVFSGMTPDEVKAYRIAHNKIPMMTGFNLEMLASDLQDLSGSGFDIDLTGFSTTDLGTIELQLEMSSAQPDPYDPSGMVEFKVKDKTPEEVPTSTQTLQYVLIFDDKEQQVRWQAFLKYLKGNVEGETHSERITTFISQYLQGSEN